MDLLSTAKFIAGSGFMTKGSSDDEDSDNDGDGPTNLFDVIPIISQFKSVFQLLFNDPVGALQTQKKFFSKCPLVSQFKSFCQLVDGDLGKAWRTQKEFFSFWWDTAVSFAEGTPGVGHIIGAIAYIAGNKEVGNRCMKSASRTSGVILGALAGTFLGGPAGAAVGAVGGGLLMDLLTTGIESFVEDKYRPNGYLAALDQVMRGEAKTGDIFDILCGIGVEATMAYLYAKQSSRVRTTVFDEHEMDPGKIRFSQTSVSEGNVDQMVDTMTKNQQKGRMG